LVQATAIAASSKTGAERASEIRIFASIN